MLVALELRDQVVALETIVALDENIERELSPQRLLHVDRAGGHAGRRDPTGSGDLDQCIGVQRVEALDLDPPTGGIADQEVVRHATARELKLRGSESSFAVSAFTPRDL